MRSIQRGQRRELRLETLGDDLEHAQRRLDVAEPVRAEIDELDVTVDQFGDHTAAHDLAAVCDAHQAARPG